MIAADTTYLPLLLGHSMPATPVDPSTGQPIENLQGRVDLLIDTLQDEKETILVPQPAFSEFLVYADTAGPKYISKIEKSPLFRWGDFDLKAAVELAAMRRRRINLTGGRETRRQTDAETWAKISFDRQIVAIAKANGAHTIYSNDDGIRRFAQQHGIKVVRMWELPRPAIEAQISLLEQLDAEPHDNVRKFALGEDEV